MLQHPLHPPHKTNQFTPLLPQVARARKAGLPIIGKPVASGLALDESAMWDANCVISSLAYAAATCAEAVRLRCNNLPAASGFQQPAAPPLHSQQSQLPVP